MQFLYLLLSVFLLCSCDKGHIISNLDHKTENKNDTTNTDRIKDLETSSISEKENLIGRLKAFITDIDGNSKRLTIIDKEQKKIIYSKEFDNSHNPQIEKVLENTILISVNNSENTLHYQLVQPDSSSIEYLECKSKPEITETNYICDGKTSTLPRFEEFENISKKINEFIVKNYENFQVKLIPYSQNNPEKTFGQRAEIIVLKDDKQIFSKKFNGKCTDCQWINIDNFEERLEINKVYRDKEFSISVNHILKDKDNNEILESEIIIIPEKNKIIRLEKLEKEEANSLAKK